MFTYRGNIGVSVRFCVGLEFFGFGHARLYMAFYDFFGREMSYRKTIPFEFSEVG